MSARLIVVLAAISALGCDGDGGGMALPDAAIDPICGNDYFYQIEVFDWSTNTAALPLTVFELGDPSNTTTSAPNGRATLCLPTKGDVTVRLESSAHLPRNEVVRRSAYQQYLSDSGEQSYRIYLLTSADLSDFGGLPANAQVLVDLRAGSLAAAGESASIDASSDASSVGTPGGAFAPGTQVTDDAPVIAFPNVSGSSSTTLTTSCAEAPSSLPIVAGEVTGALVYCGL